MILETTERLITTILRTLPPVLLAGLGGMIAARVKINNLGLEGMMLIGAFVGAVCMYFTGNPYLALLGAIAIGALMGVMFGFLRIRFHADNLVVSVAINMFALGITVYLMKVIFKVRGAVSLPDMRGLPNIRIPVLDQIPVLRGFSGHSVLVYLSLFLVAVFQYVMYHTAFGLRIRAAGPNPMAVTTSGCNVKLYQYTALIISGMLGALGGAHLSLGQLAMFSDNMTNGRGFIAIAATTFGNFTPLGTFAGALLFSATDAATMRFQTAGLPSPLIQMIPYSITLLMLWIMAAKRKKMKRM